MSTAPPAPPSQDQTLIEVDSVSKWFGDLVAVSDVSFSIGPGVTARGSTPVRWATARALPILIPVSTTSETDNGP